MTAVGIPRETLPRIFDPFLRTTVPGSADTGTLSSYLYGIIREHNCEISRSRLPDWRLGLTVSLPICTQSRIGSEPIHRLSHSGAAPAPTDQAGLRYREGESGLDDAEEDPRHSLFDRPRPPATFLWTAPPLTSEQAYRRRRPAF